MPRFPRSYIMYKLSEQHEKYYNKKYNRVGYVFRDRYKSEGIYSEEHLYNCIKYIYDNPVKAGICKKAEISTTTDTLYRTDKGYNYNTDSGEPNKYAAYGLRYKFESIPFTYKGSETSVWIANSSRADTDTSSGFKDLTGTALGLFDMRKLENYGTSTSYYYWLVSPYSSGRARVYYVSYNFSYVYFDSYHFGVRPVVSLPSNIELTVVNN